MRQGGIDKVFAGLDTSLRKYKSEFGQELQARVEQRTPVGKSGHLKRSWGFVMKAKDIEIYNVADYANYVEYGTIYMAPRGMLRATLLEAEQVSEVAAKRAGIKT